MAINEASFENEKELQDWAFSNSATFLPESQLITGFQISTTSGKNGVPDGFALSIPNREWYLVECELLSHGVWPHIAEQITRFVVALQNSETTRKVRNHFFEHVLSKGIITEIASLLDTIPERLHQQLELFLESIEPKLIIFIDETNRDLEDMAQALDIPVSIFRVKKFIVDGNAEYYSPDIKAPVLEIEAGDEGPKVEYDVIELLDGGELVASVRRFRCYRLNDNSVIQIRKSKYYATGDYYWYGISTSSLELIKEYSVTDLVFVMGEFGYVKVPMSVVYEHLTHAFTSKNTNGDVRHYHCYISHGPEPILFSAEDKPKFPLAEYFHPFN